MDLDAAAAASGQKKNRSVTLDKCCIEGNNNNDDDDYCACFSCFILKERLYAQKSYIHRVTKISLTTHVIFKRIFRIKMKFFHLLFFTLGKEFFLLLLIVFSFYFIFHFVRLFALYKNVIHM